MKAKVSGQPNPTKAEPRGMAKRELGRLKRTWRDAARNLVKALPTPSHATLNDTVALFDAVLDEIGVGRKILRALARTRPAKKAVA